MVRLSQVPGEMLDDRKVSSPRGFAIKVFNVDGPKLPQHEGHTTQDFVLETGKSFFAKTPEVFLEKFKPNATVAPILPESIKGVVSMAAKAANAALHTVGLDSETLDVFGHPNRHPLGESYYSQAAIRYGNYVAKLGVTPASETVRSLVDKTVEMKDEDALRTAIVEFFRTNEARYDFSVQLAIDPKTTPIEDATVEWPEKLSPYRPIATLVLPPQDAYLKKRQETVDYTWSFAPGHALIAHRPLGSIMRARLAVYSTMSVAKN